MRNTQHAGVACLLRIVTVACMTFAVHSHAAPLYTVVDLGTLGGQSEAFAISNTGVIVGDSDAPTQVGSPLRATLFSPGVAPTAFQRFGGPNLFSRAFGVNDAGRAVGIAAPSSSCCTRATSFSEGASAIDLGSLGGTSFSSEAYAINNAGQIVGVSDTATGNRATLFGIGAAPIDLGVVNGLTTSIARAINDHGQVVGQSGSQGLGPELATLFSIGGSATNLGVLSGYSSSAARDVNDGGVIVGVSFGIGASRATLFSQSANPVDLGRLGGSRSMAESVNSSGLIVGFSTLAGDLVSHATLFDPLSGATDLNDLIDPMSGWELMDATAINDRGQIVGFGVVGGQFRAFLATPIPAPGTLLLVLLGFGLAWRRTHRRHPHSMQHHQNLSVR